MVSTTECPFAGTPATTLADHFLPSIMCVYMRVCAPGRRDSRGIITTGSADMYGIQMSVCTLAVSRTTGRTERASGCRHINIMHIMVSYIGVPQRKSGMVLEHRNGLNSTLIYPSGKCKTHLWCHNNLNKY